MAQKTGQIQTPDQRMSGNNQKEQIRSNPSAGLGSSDIENSMIRNDMSQMAQQYFDSQAGKPTSYASQSIQKSNRNGSK
jgi:hypothetical protein